MSRDAHSCFQFFLLFFVTCIIITVHFAPLSPFLSSWKYNQLYRLFPVESQRQPDASTTCGSQCCFADLTRGHACALLPLIFNALGKRIFKPNNTSKTQQRKHFLPPCHARISLHLLCKCTTHHPHFPQISLLLHIDVEESLLPT